MKAVANKIQGQSMVAEDALRRAVDTTPAFIHTARPDGYLDYFNRGWLDFLGKSLDFFPRRRTAGLLVVTLLFLEAVSGFAGLYVGTEVFSSVKTPLDALYTSSFTLAFTDYSPKPGYGQLVVLGQLVSGVLLLVALFPLLISRISTFKHV
jgi:hypothetical protein